MMSCLSVIHFPFQLSDDKHPVVKEDIGENVVFCLEEV
ncbi:hypothetical protein BOVAC1_5202 [Bacteroides ovatus]|nr:hypothetical protein BOVAC1_5202 [Bacteroides ovatus]